MNIFAENMRKFIFFILTVFITAMWAACHKDPIITDTSAKLNFSQDSVLFDTVFTRLGSTTKQFKIYNRNNKRLIISNIRLGQGANSMFRLNVNGLPGKTFKDVEVPGNDSLFVFVEVTVDPTNVNNPFIIADSVVFETNGNIQDINLIAWGQNAHYLVPNVFPTNGLPNYSVIPCDTTWADNLPHIIYGFAVVDSGCRLSITAGAKIYFYKNSGLWVFREGNLNVTGTKEAPVVFQGIRLEQDYKDIPGQWDRIWINEGSFDNVIDHAIIKNGFIGIQAETLDPTQPLGNTLTIKNTEIKNMAGMGILSRVYNITATNTIISNCGQYAMALTGGGTHDFKHCTFANYWSTPRKTPSVFLSNYYIRGNVTVLNHLQAALFGNCIIYGNSANEIGTDFNEDVSSNYLFDHSIIKIDPATPTPSDHYTDVQINTDPSFKDLMKYELNGGSPAINKGLKAYGIQVPFDFNNVLRVSAADPNPDLGAIEYK